MEAASVAATEAIVPKSVPEAALSSALIPVTAVDQPAAAMALAAVGSG